MRKYRKSTKRLKKKIAKYICLGLVVLAAVPTYNKVENTISNNESTSSVSSNYSGSAYTEVNNNIPDFTQEELNITNSYEYYSDLDSLGRCQAAEVCIGKDLMPTEKRGAIGMVKPTGWHTVKYDNVDGKYLYNRCHLIGYQLTGENANKKNLITGTRYLNTIGMLPFENEVADYVKSSGNHVMYRVTPDFDGSNLLANGVYMEAESIEDNGAGIKFNIYCYNVQPGIGIDYATGDSWSESSSDGDNSSVNTSSLGSSWSVSDLLSELNSILPDFVK